MTSTYISKTAVQYRMTPTYNSKTAIQYHMIYNNCPLLPPFTIMGFNPKQRRITFTECSGS